MLMGMNSDDEKTVVISSTSTTNEWPQHMIPNDHHQKSLIINQSPNNNNNNNKNMASSTIVDQKPGQDHPHQTLKCPRCDSSNTKFCYYNNYSLSQPRHFCKACKRYWTRGGTLRNVPVGGGCRKNKRLKRSSSAAAAAAANNSSPGSSNLGPASSRPSTESQHHSSIHSLLTSGQSSHIGSLLYNTSTSSLPFSRYDMSVQPHSLIGNALGLGFSNNNNNNVDQNNTDALVLSSNPLLSNYSSILSSSSPTIASLLASKFTNGTIRASSLSSNSNNNNNNFQGLGPFEELNIGHEAGLVNNNKQVVKMEFEGQGRSSSSSALESWINGADHHHNHNHHHRTDQIGFSSDPSLYWASSTAVGGGASWHDPTANIGVPSLI